MFCERVNIQNLRCDSLITLQILRIELSLAFVRRGYLLKNFKDTSCVFSGSFLVRKIFFIFRVPSSDPSGRSVILTDLEFQRIRVGCRIFIHKFEKKFEKDQ